MSEDVKFTPTRDLLVIRPILAEENLTDWGFQLPPGDQNDDTPQKGLVIAVGPGRQAKLSPPSERLVEAMRALMERYHAMPNVNWGVRGFHLGVWQEADDALKEFEGTRQTVPMTVKVGDRVIYSRFGYQSYRIDGEDVHVTQEASIMAILEK